jgi:hypothetical protein
VAQADTMLALSEVVGTAGNAAEAHATAEAALRLYERKGDLVSATKARKYIGWLSDAPDGPDRDRREMHAAAQPRHT